MLAVFDDGNLVLWAGLDAGAVIGASGGLAQRGALPLANLVRSGIGLAGRAERPCHNFRPELAAPDRLTTRARLPLEITAFPDHVWFTTHEQGRGVAEQHVEQCRAASRGAHDDQEVQRIRVAHDFSPVEVERALPAVSVTVLSTPLPSSRNHAGAQPLRQVRRPSALAPSRSPRALERSPDRGPLVEV
jgi:hypothetical protein